MKQKKTGVLFGFGVQIHILMFRSLKLSANCCLPLTFKLGFLYSIFLHKLLVVICNVFKLNPKSKSHIGIGLQVWFQNARAKFRRNVLRQENGGVDKADGTSLPPPSSDSGALTPPTSAATLTDLTNPSITVVTSVTSSLDSHDSGSPSQTTLTNLF